MPTTTPYPKPRWLHRIDSNTVLCLTARGLNERTYPPPADGVQQPGAPAQTDKIWIQWFKRTSHTLFANIAGLNHIHQVLSQECQAWGTPELQGDLDVPPGTDADAALWAQFVAQSKNKSIANLIEVAKAHITQIKSALKLEVLSWPPLGHNDVNGIRRRFRSKNPGYVSNDGVDFPDFKPFVFSVFDKVGNSIGEAHLIVTQDCEWPGSERSGSDWRSWGIVTNFSLEIVSNEPKNSYSSSSSYYSTSSKI